MHAHFVIELFLAKEIPFCTVTYNQKTDLSFALYAIGFNFFNSLIRILPESGITGNELFMGREGFLRINVQLVYKLECMLWLCKM